MFSVLPKDTRRSMPPPLPPAVAAAREEEGAKDDDEGPSDSADPMERTVSGSVPTRLMLCSEEGEPPSATGCSVGSS